jgi:outer membrane protein assembly factor BamD
MRFEKNIRFTIWLTSLRCLAVMKSGKVLFTLMILGLAMSLITGCSDYNKALKGSDYALKREVAMEMYQKKKYAKAVTLFEELYTVMRSGPGAEEITYYFAQSHFGAGDYLLANFYFELFVKTYQRSAWYEEAWFMSGYALYKAAPAPQLDPSSTRDAIQKLQQFIDRFTDSPKAAEATALIEELRSRLDLKSYRGAQLYFDQGYYQAASKAFEYTLMEFPDSPRRFEMQYKVVRSLFMYAEKSIKSKRKERYEQVLEKYRKFAPQLTGSAYELKSKELFDLAQARIAQINQQSE